MIMAQKCELYTATPINNIDQSEMVVLVSFNYSDIRLA
jgi:hypothetical protein